MFDQWVMYEAGEGSSGGGGMSFDRLREDYPWLLAILEAHRKSCNPDNWINRVFGLSGNDVVCSKCKTTVANWQCDRKSSMTVGVIGFGNFGQFFAKHITRAFYKVTVTDVVKREKEAADSGLAWGSLEEAASRDIVVLAVPFQNLEQLLKQISAFVRSDGLVIDVCSVKQSSIKLMLEHLPSSVEVVGTHPLFGPQSAKRGLDGHRIVLCPQRLSDQRLDKIQSLMSLGFGLRTFEIDAEAHDREMAMVQALTHFIARGLAGCSIRESELATVAFDKLFEVAELLGGDSWELFQTIELGNPFAAEIRAQFMEELKQLERRLEE